MNAWSFGQSAWVRLSFVALFAACAVFGVRSVETRSVASVKQRVEPRTEAGDLKGELVLESTVPIAEWRVTLDGAALAPVDHDALNWRGNLSAQADDEMLVEAVGAPTSGRRALRVAGDREVIFWSEGDIVERVELKRIFGGTP